MMTEEVPVTQARAELSDLVSRVAYAGARIILTRNGKPLAALVPINDLALDDFPSDDEQGGAEPVRHLGLARTEPVLPAAAMERPHDIAAEFRQPPAGGTARPL
jgi:prevent-host-death family protein